MTLRVMFAAALTVVVSGQAEAQPRDTSPIGDAVDAACKAEFSDVGEDEIKRCRRAITDRIVEGRIKNRMERAYRRAMGLPLEQ